MWSKGLDFILFTNQNSARSSIWLADEKIVKSCNYYMLNSTITSGEFLSQPSSDLIGGNSWDYEPIRNKLKTLQSEIFIYFWQWSNVDLWVFCRSLGNFIFGILEKKTIWITGIIFNFSTIGFRSNGSDRKLCRIEFSFLTVVVIWPTFRLSKYGQNWLMCIKIVWS